jgi:hypothetical protein
MNMQLQAQVKSASTSGFTPIKTAFLQRKSACGDHTSGECAECSQKNRFGLQTKLIVNEPGDIHEKEADRMADLLMATTVESSVRGALPPVQRFGGQSYGQTEAAPASVDHALGSPGRPFEPSLRNDMEQRFGHDFSKVRVHTDAKAAESAQDLHARAYTVGNDIAFGQGQYEPAATQGRHLLAHELTHVIQQTGARGKASLPQLNGEHLVQRAPAAVATKTVSIDAVKLRGSKRDPASDVTFANTVFRPANVQFSLGKNETATDADSDTWLGGGTSITKGACKAASKEELDTWNGSTSKFKLGGSLRSFYVASVFSGEISDRGYSFPPYCATGNAAPLNGMSVVTNTGANRTLAHELGHILLNSGDHPADTKNLMHSTNTATGNDLTATQQATIYHNSMHMS